MVTSTQDRTKDPGAVLTLFLRFHLVKKKERKEKAVKLYKKFCLATEKGFPNQFSKIDIVCKGSPSTPTQPRGLKYDTLQLCFFYMLE